MIDVPEAFVRQIVGREGPQGERWIASLPSLIEELLERWSCTPSGPPMHGRVGIVIPVRRADKTTAVLKVSFPHPANVYEPTAFVTWSGRGAVLLYERDDARFAMLLERAEQSTLATFDDDDDEAATVCGRLVRRLAVPAPPDVPRLSERASAQEQEIREASTVLSTHVPRRAVEAALSTVRELGREQPDTLLHADLHYKNVVRAAREPWLVIDPRGVAGDPAYDAASVLIGAFQRQRALDGLCAGLRRRLAVFADAAELDRSRVFRWVQARSLLYAYRERKSSQRAAAIQLADRVATDLTYPRTV